MDKKTNSINNNEYFNKNQLRRVKIWKKTVKYSITYENSYFLIMNDGITKLKP
jgi:hypothetical protein